MNQELGEIREQWESGILQDGGEIITEYSGGHTHHKIHLVLLKSATGTYNLMRYYNIGNWSVSVDVISKDADKVFKKVFELIDLVS